MPGPASPSQVTPSNSERLNNEKQPERVEDDLPPATSQVPIGRPKGRLAWITIVAAILSSAFLFALDNTITADIQPAIVREYGDARRLSWISVSFLLTAAGTNLLWGRLYGNFENKWVYITSIIIFQVGSAVCGAAPTLDALIIGRALCGVGGVGMYIGVLSLLSSLTTLKERPVYLAMCGVVWGVGTVSGPFIGGGFAESSATWRWGFYINLVVGAVFAPVYLFLIPRIDPRPDTAIHTRLRAIDWAGAILLFGMIAALLMGIAFGGLIYPWSSDATIALFTVGGITFSALAVQQAFALLTTPTNRLFPLQFLRRPQLAVLFPTIAAAGTITFVPIFFIPLYYQLARGDSPLTAGLRLLPFILLLVTMNMVSGVMMGKLRYYSPWFAAGSALAIVASALLYALLPDINLSSSAIYGFTALLGFGTGSFSQAPFSIAQALVLPQESALATSFISCAQVSGAAIGVAIANAVFLNSAAAGIAKALPALDDDAIQGLLLGTESAVFGALDEDARIGVAATIARTLARVFIITVSGGLLVLVLSAFMWKGKLNLSGIGAGI